MPDPTRPIDQQPEPERFGEAPSSRPAGPPSLPAVLRKRLAEASVNRCRLA